MHLRCQRICLKRPGMNGWLVGWLVGSWGFVGRFFFRGLKKRGGMFQKSWKYLCVFFWGGGRTLQMFGNFEHFPWKHSAWSLGCKYKSLKITNPNYSNNIMMPPCFLTHFAGGKEWECQKIFFVTLKICLDPKKIHQKCCPMGVSKNRGTPKSSILIGFSLINHPFWGTTIFGNIPMVS